MKKVHNSIVLTTSYCSPYFVHTYMPHLPEYAVHSSHAMFNLKHHTAFYMSPHTDQNLFPLYLKNKLHSSVVLFRFGSRETGRRHCSAQASIRRSNTTYCKTPIIRRLRLRLNRRRNVAQCHPRFSWNSTHLLAHGTSQCTDNARSVEQQQQQRILC